MASIYLIPNLLGESALTVLSPQVAQAVQELTYFVVENEKSARKFIKLIAPEKPQSELQISVIDKHQSTPDYAAYLTPCLQGHSIGIISEAGCPGVADPGAEIVRVAHQKALRVIPLVGPSSLLLAMMSSGLNGQNFAFNGYLPIDKQVRNQQLLSDLIETLQPDTLLCIATDLTLPTESIRTLPIRQWKHTSVDLQKRPTLFIIGR